MEAAELAVRLQGAGVVVKEVESWKARRMRKMIPQTYDFSCGAAALATVMKYHFGYEMTEKDAIMGMIKTGNLEELHRYGFSLFNMKSFCEDLKYQARGFHVPNVNVLKRLPMPLIVLISTGQYNHFVVIRYVDDSYVHISDPSWGNRRMSLQDFDQSWSQKVIFVITGPFVGSPEGLYQEVADMKLPLYDELRNGIPGMLDRHFAMDYSQAVLFNYRPQNIGLPFYGR
jgi:predicted double-glycine peptidase